MTACLWVTVSLFTLGKPRVCWGRGGEGVAPAVLKTNSRGQKEHSFLYQHFNVIFLFFFSFVFQVQIFGSFKTGLYLPTRLVFVWSFCTLWFLYTLSIGGVEMGLFCFGDRVFLCSPSYSGACYVGSAGLLSAGINNIYHHTWQDGDYLGNKIHQFIFDLRFLK